MKQKPNQEETAQAPAQSNAFTRLLSEFREGKSITELSETLQKCIQNACETGKSKLTYTMEFTLTGGGRALVIVDSIQAKLTPPERDQNIFFVTEEHGLSRSNPNQRELDLKTVEREEPEVREVVARTEVMAGR